MDLNTRPPEPFVRVSIPLFFAICVLSGMMIGTGLGRGATLNGWWYLLAAAGLGLNIVGWIFRNKTRIIEFHETVDKIIEELRKPE